MHNQPFDLARINYEVIRKQKRKKLLKWSVIPIALVFLLSLWFILPMLLTHTAIGNYTKNSFANARRWLALLTVTSPEPFVIAFNSGTVDTKLGKYDRAEKELTRAVAIAPPDKVCMAAQNLVGSLKAHTEAVKDIPKEAKEYETKAELVMKDHPDCFKGSAAQGGASSSSDSQSQSPSESQQQQLQQKEQEGRERQSQYASEEAYDPNDPSLKPW